jgi:hypothetical protein
MTPEEPLADRGSPLIEEPLLGDGRPNRIPVVTPYVFGIVFVCAAGGFALSRVVTRYVIDLIWRRVILSIGVAAVAFYIGVHLRGSDEWGFAASLLYGCGSLLGWVAGFGIAMSLRR